MYGIVNQLDIHIYLQRTVLSIECPVVMGRFVLLFTLELVYYEKRNELFAWFRETRKQGLTTLTFCFHILFPVNCSRSVAFIITSHKTPSLHLL